MAQTIDGLIAATMIAPVVDWAQAMARGYELTKAMAGEDEMAACPHCNDTGAVRSAVAGEGLEDCPRCSAG